MNEKEIEIETEGEDTIPVNDKRRFNESGERVKDDEIPKVPSKSPAEIALEATLKAEIERREAG